MMLTYLAILRPRSRSEARSSGRGLRPEELREFSGTVSDAEHRAVGPESHPGFERSGIDSVESKSIDELHHGSDRGAIVACSSQRDTAGSTMRMPALFHLVVAEVIETLHQSRRREMMLHDDARAHRC